MKLTLCLFVFGFLLVSAAAEDSQNEEVQPRAAEVNEGNDEQLGARMLGMEGPTHRVRVTTKSISTSSEEPANMFGSSQVANSGTSGLYYGASASGGRYGISGSFGGSVQYPGLDGGRRVNVESTWGPLENPIQSPMQGIRQVMTGPFSINQGYNPKRIQGQVQIVEDGLVSRGNGGVSDDGLFVQDGFGGGLTGKPRRTTIIKEQKIEETKEGVDVSPSGGGIFGSINSNPSPYFSPKQTLESEMPLRYPNFPSVEGAYRQVNQIYGDQGKEFITNIPGNMGMVPSLGPQYGSFLEQGRFYDASGKLIGRPYLGGLGDFQNQYEQTQGVTIEEGLKYKRPSGLYPDDNQEKYGEWKWSLENPGKKQESRWETIGKKKCFCSYPEASVSDLGFYPSVNYQGY